MRGVLAVLIAALHRCAALNPTTRRGAVLETTRRGIAFGILAFGLPAAAKQDCIKDCVSNCLRVAPGNAGYCGSNCDEYCSQTDREDGLSGSVSSDKGYVGLSSPLRGGDTVEYGADAPPRLDVLPRTLLPTQLRRESAPEE